MCVCRTLSHSSSAIYSSGLSWGSTCVTGFGTSLCSALNGCIKPQAAPTRTLLSLSVVLGFIHFPFCVCVCHAPSQHGFSLLLLSQRLVLRIGNTGPDTTNGPASGSTPFFHSKLGQSLLVLGGPLFTTGPRTPCNGLISPY